MGRTCHGADVVPVLVGVAPQFMLEFSQGGTVIPTANNRILRIDLYELSSLQVGVRVRGGLGFALVCTRRLGCSLGYNGVEDEAAWPVSGIAWSLLWCAAAGH